MSTILLNDTISFQDSFDKDFLTNNLNPNDSIILFTPKVSESNFLFELHQKKQIDKLIIITNTREKSMQKRLFVNSRICQSILEHVKKQLFIVIELIDNYDYMKNVIQNLIQLKHLSQNLHIQLGITDHHSIILGCANYQSTYFTDLIHSLKAIYLTDKRTQYEFLYDTVCQYLDSEFDKNHFCQFQNDSCIANRNHTIPHSQMGCCYSFEYANFWSPTFIKNIQLCDHLNCKTCSTKCISCKMFTCKTLKEKNIQFTPHNILLLDCFFNKKQHLILESNFFKTKEEIIHKLLESNHSFYFWYYLTKKYYI